MKENKKQGSRSNPKFMHMCQKKKRNFIQLTGNMQNFAWILIFSHFHANWRKDRKPFQKKKRLVKTECVFFVTKIPYSKV